MALSAIECTNIQDEIRIAVEKKAEKEEEKQRIEEEQAALKKTLEKVSEAEERECLWEKNMKRRAEEIEKMMEDFREKQGASTRYHKKERPQPPRQHKTTMARIIKKKAAKKMKKNGPPHWLGEKSVLSQMEEHVPLDAITAFHMRARDIRKKDDLSEAEKREQYKSIAEQIRDHFHNMRRTERASLACEKREEKK